MQRLSSAGYQGPEVFFAMGDFSTVRWQSRPLHQSCPVVLKPPEEEDANQWRAFGLEVNAAAFSMFLIVLAYAEHPTPGF